MPTESQIVEFINAYKECALWSTNDESDESGGVSLDRNYSVENMSSETIEYAEKDCREFIERNEELLNAVGDYSQHGHDFFLTRNGHGAGFWCRNYGTIGELLTTSCKLYYPEVHLYVGDDGMIYGS